MSAARAPTAAGLSPTFRDTTTTATTKVRTPRLNLLPELWLLPYGPFLGPFFSQYAYKLLENVRLYFVR